MIEHKRKRLEDNVAYYIKKAEEAVERNDADMADDYYELAQRNADRLTVLANQE